MWLWVKKRDLVERAKEALMAQKGLFAAEAFRRMQKQSMNTRRSMREIAEAILLAEKI